MQLKQLLELGIDSTFDVVFPEIDSSTVLAEVPRMEEVYRTALEVMPQMESGRLNIQSALAGERVAKADGLPTVTASAAIGTGNTSGTNYSFYNQLNNKLNESAGITVSVPIFNNRQARTSRAKARLETRQAELNYADAEKSLLTTVESLYQDAVSAQSRYRAATDKVRSAGLSYSLVLGQFEAGMNGHRRTADREEQLSGGPAGADTGQVSGRHCRSACSTSIATYPSNCNQKTRISP